MKIKETICTEVDARGRVIKRTRTVDVIDSYTDRDESDRDGYRRFSDLHQASSKRIFEAYEDYRMSSQW